MHAPKGFIKLVMLSTWVLLAVACGSRDTSDTSSNQKNLTASNAEANANIYLRSENAFTFAQVSQFAYDLTPSGKAASEIVGKTLSESKLWQNKKFESRLRKLMGSDYAIMKKYWNTETPIKKFGDFLMMTGCEQQNCADNQYVILIDLGDGRVNVIHIGKDSTRQWNSYREIDRLPPPFAEALEEMKSRKVEDD